VSQLIVGDKKPCCYLSYRQDREYTCYKNGNPAWIASHSGTLTEVCTIIPIKRPNFVVRPAYLWSGRRWTF